MAAAPGVRRSELGDALRACREAFIGVGLMSCMINLLYLTGSVFMLEIYDRVLPSRSVPTLVGLVVIAGGLYIAQGALDLLRGRILGRIGTSLDEAINGRVFDTVVRLPLVAGARNEGLQPLRDLDNVRSFLGSQGPGAFFDLPWLPFYIAICFAFHWLLGVTALAGAVILVTLTVITEFMSRAPAREAMTLAARRNDLAASSRRNAEVLVAMGMAGRLNARWSEANETYLAGNQRASDVAGGLGAVAKVLRMMLQSAVLAVGAYLVIHQEATAGIIIAGSILSARALAPVDLAIAHWKGFVAARQSWHRLSRLLLAMPAPNAQTLLQAPARRLSVEGVSMVAPGDQRMIVQDVSFAAEAGSGVGVIGPSGSGKSSLVRALVGVWTPARGKVRLDGAALDQWSSDALGRHIGYLPQDVELFGGSVAQNICRFDPGARSEDIIAAAQEAGVHEMIIKMREGYDTQIGEQGTALSAGQAQRVALARALYG
ncbi:type I secretion system permease/ATPase, partial [Bradyrhizobium sp.]|uniref:type I secretion system permease/ATPase n=1 Tax=Bradyrhizobium sp. TaxID=376 RepID=UPI003C710070